jgi:hypothetical protein
VSEIRAVIFKNLAEDFSSLLACSLVHRARLSEARDHVFQLSMIMQIPRKRDNATMFLALCQSTHSTILAAMKTAILYIEERDSLEKVLSNLTMAPRLKKINFLDCGLDEDLLATFRDIFRQCSTTRTGAQSL